MKVKLGAYTIGVHGFSAHLYPISSEACEEKWSITPKHKCHIDIQPTAVTFQKFHQAHNNLTAWTEEWGKLRADFLGQD